MSIIFMSRMRREKWGHVAFLADRGGKNGDMLLF